MRTTGEHEIQCIVEGAIDEFNRQEQFLLIHDLSEQCICSKFASYLEKQLQNSRFREYVVDVEYNRGMRRDSYAAKEKPDTGKKIILDLVVHKREYDSRAGYDNLFCIEMKKGQSERKLAENKDRLKTMVNHHKGYCYRASYLIVIFSGRKRERNRLEIESTYYLSDSFDWRLTT